MLTTKTVRSVIVVILFTAYIVLAVCDIKAGNIRTGVVSALFAVVTWLIFF